jgi:hypothetical protein
MTPNPSSRVICVTFAALSGPGAFSDIFDPDVCLDLLSRQHPLPWTGDASLGYGTMTIVDAEGSVVCRVRCRCLDDLLELGEQLERINDFLPVTRVLH